VTSWLWITGVRTKFADVKEAMESVDAKVLDLPPYSPDFNPIERVFSKMKTLVRKAKMRKMENLWYKLSQLCNVFSPKECQNDLQSRRR
jgi:transposase